MSIASSEVLIFDGQLLEERDYWRNRLSGMTATSSLPPDYDTAQAHSANRSVVELSLPASLVRDLEELTSNSPFLIYTTFLAAVKICLHKYSEGQTITVGSPPLKELGKANSLAIVTEIDSGMTFRQLLVNLRQTLLEAYEKQNYPFDYLRRDLGLDHRNGSGGFFDLVVMLRDLHGEMSESSNAVTVTIDSDLDGLYGSIQFNPSLYVRETIVAFANHLVAVLEGAVGNRDRRLSDLDMMTAAERRKVLADWNATTTAYPRDKCLNELFEEQVERNPEAVALIFSNTEISYGELNRRANKLAHHLRELGVGPETIVGLCVERSIEMMVGMLGILKAGGAYLPLDPQYPLERLHFMLEDASVPVLLTQEHLLGSLPTHWSQVICLDTDWESISQHSDENLKPNVNPENLAYVMYTSGSTGMPKGVSVVHRNVVRLVKETNYADFSSEHVFLQLAPLTFDASTFELWGSLLNGGKLAIMSPGTPALAELSEALQRYEVSTLWLTAGLFHLMVDQGVERLSRVRQLVAGGDVLSVAHVKKVLAKLDESSSLINGYGPTEATTFSCCYPMGRDTSIGATVPIGVPIGNTEVYVLDQQQQPVAVGVAGELYIGGDGLARGYLQSPELTAERFVPHPFATAPGARLYRTGDLVRYRADGQIHFLGRMDHQVKVRGFRIELGEIESVLKQHSGVQNAAVIMREDRPNEKRLAAYVVPRESQAPSVNELLDFLKQRLPDFMMPQAFVTLEQLPLSANGKVDRRMLPAPDQGRPDLEEAFIEPSGEVEQTLARIWREVLTVERIGANDNFFALGGESILAIQVVARANQAGLNLQTRHIFEHQTIAELALVAGTAPAVEAEQGEVSGPAPLTPIQHWFFEQNLPEPHHFNQSVMLETDETLNREALKAVFDQLLRHHDALRMRYSTNEGEWQQFNFGFDEGAAVEYFDLSSLPEDELSKAIEQHAEELQASLNLSDGPLLCVALFDCGRGKPTRLLLIVHHLVVDGVSWRIMLDDLQTGYAQALRGEEIDFGPKTTSFKHWSERLVDYSRGVELDAEKAYWLKFANVNAPSLPVDHESKANTVESSRRVYVALDTDETKALLQEVPAAYNTQINDVLLTAVLQAFHTWTGERSLLLTLEGHGREEILDNVDLSRTVGWFTSEYPVFLTLGESRSEGESLCLVKEQLRAIPQRGIGYGLLRYLSDDTELGQLAKPEISFNYLGQFDQVLSESSLFRGARESKGQTQSPRGNMPHLLQINGSVAGGRLQLSLTYSEKVFRPETIERFGEGLGKSLRASIAHCQSPEAGGFTPSDFPLADLTQSELNLVAGSDNQIADIYPLTPFQNGLLFHALYAPGSDVYFMQLSATIEDQQLDAAKFRRAWQRVLDRHQILRTAFVWEGVREALQVVRHQVALPWQELDWRDLSEHEQQEQLSIFLKNDERRGFVLSEAPLMRCTLIRLADDAYRFIWSVHHLLLDGWAMMHVVKEIFDFYDAFASGRELSLSVGRPFRDYIAWLQQQDEAKAETFWRTSLAGFTSPTPMEIARQDRNQEAKEDYFDQRYKLSPGTSDALKDFARRHHLTLNTIVQGIFGLLLGRYGDSDDVVFGATVSGRPATLLGVESMVGVFLNTLPVRVQISPQDALVSWFTQLQEQQAHAQQFEYTPLPQVQAWSDVPRGRPLFETILIFENYPMDASLKQKREGLVLRDVSSIDRANYPLAVGASPGAQLHFRFSYDRRVFEDETIARMFGHLETMLEAVIANPNQRLVDLPLLTFTEQQQLLVEWNGTANPSVPQSTLHELFEAQVQRFPEAMALWTHEAELSYAELNKRANQLAHFLREQGVGPEVLVGICMERSREMVISMLAVVKAGGAYVPLDPEYPLGRLQYMMEEINAWVVLTQARLAEGLPAHWGQVVNVDEESFESYSSENPVSNVDGDNLANLIFTSGSTGKPKASFVTHRGLCNTILHRTEALSLSHEDRFLQTNSFSFDASVWEFFAPLTTGAELVMLKPGGYQDPHYIVDMLAQRRITVVEFPPSWLRMVLQEPGLERCTELKHVICGGQILTGELQETFYSRLNAQLHNYYGPTEASIDATGFTCKRDAVTRTAPIGKPISNVQVYILDDLLRPVPIGVPGELHIGGDGVARGYLNLAALTAEKFIPNPFSGESGARLYKTGDVTRYLPDGVIEFCGRNDDQVKIRGFRIELGEIEAVLVQYEEVLEAAVVGREDTPGDKRLVAYVVAAPDRQPTIDQLRTYLMAKLPDHMVPGSFVMLEKLPRNLNGKVDREALPAPDLSRPQLETPFVAPRNSSEEILARIWVEVLGVKQVGIDDNFFALGGDSIRSVQVLSKAQQEGLSFSLQSIFQQQTIRRLAEEIAPVGSEAALQTTPFSLVSAEDLERLPDDAEDAYPLTMLQAGMIFHTEYHPDSAVYHSISSRRIRAKLNVDGLRNAIQRIVEQHSVLRTSFHLHGFSEPLQVVRRSVVVPVTEHDLRDLETAGQERIVADWLEAEKIRPFEWTKAPLLRLHVHRYTDDEFQFTFTGHHSILDGWSDSIVFSDLFKRYVGSLKGEDEPAGPSPGVPYREFVSLERRALESEETKNYWNEKLSDSVIMPLPRWTSPKPGAQLKWVPIPVSEDVSEALKKITQVTGIPIKDVLLAVHMKVMSLLAGHRDVITGLISNGRPEMTDGERMVGLFLNTLPFRMNLPAGSWIDLAEKVFAAEKELLPHRRYPLAKIQRDQGGQSLFETAFNFTQFHLYQELRGFSEVEVLNSLNVAETNFTLLFDISIGVNTHKVQAQVAGNISELQEEQVAAVAGYYAKALEAMALDPHAKHDEISLLGKDEQQQQLIEWNPADVDLSSGLTVLDLFEQQTRRTPEAFAVVSDGVTLTYAELNTRANQLARHLVKLGVGPEELVGVCVERSMEMVVAILGVLKAGGAYVPLDPSYPKDRLAFIGEDARVRVIVAQEKVLESLPEHGAELVCIDTEWDRISVEPATNPTNQATADNSAYVIYTSGSTGKPKGVSITHRNILRLFEGTKDYFNFNEKDVWTLFHSYAFDFSVWELWGALLYGGKLIVVPYMVSRTPEAFYQMLQDEGVTVLNQTPSAFRQLIEVDRKNAAELSLRLVIFGGEALELNSLKPWFEIHGDERPQLVNMYGITETTVHVTYRPLRIADVGNHSVIGSALPDLKIYVLDEHLRLLPVGVAGEMYVGGAGLGRGYLNRPELTAQRFIPDTFATEAGARLYKTGDLARFRPSGELEYAGRADNQVKIRGFRIELGEIEATLNNHPAVRDAVVHTPADESGETRLVAYVVTGLDAEAVASELRDYLKEKLPAHMVPQGFVVMDQLPLGHTGKIDRRALPAWQAVTVEHDESPDVSRLPIEDMLAGIWAEVLRVEHVAVGDNFFDLGGHSLLATQVISRVRETFKAEIPLLTLFEVPRLSDFAAVVEAALREEVGISAPPITPVNRDAAPPVSFAQQRLWISQQLVKGAGVYHLPVALRLKGELNVAALERALNEVIRRHEALRTTFALADGKTVQVIASSLELELPVFDLSEMSDREAEAQRMASDFMQTPFDLSNGPLLRAQLLCMHAEEHIALFVMHHIISDGWSMGVLVREVATLYDAFMRGRPSPLPELPVQYADFAAWQREWLQGEVLESQLDYWRKQLGPQPPELVMPIDRPRPPVQTHNGARLPFTIAGETQRQLNALSRREGVTIFMTLLAAFQTLLYRYSSQEDIVVGTDMANRNRAETESVIGFFVNMLVLRTDLSGNPTFRELLTRVREVSLGAYAHQDLPFDRLVDELEPERDPSRNPLFQAVFVLQNNPSEELRLPGITLSPFRFESNHVQFDLILTLTEGRDSIMGVVSYNTDLFDESTISEMVNRYQALLQAIVEDPAQRIADVRLTTTDGVTREDFPRAEISQKDFENLLAQLATSSS